MNGKGQALCCRRPFYWSFNTPGNSPNPRASHPLSVIRTMSQRNTVPNKVHYLPAYTGGKKVDFCIMCVLIRKGGCHCRYPSEETVEQCSFLSEFVTSHVLHINICKKYPVWQFTIIVKFMIM